MRFFFIAIFLFAFHFLSAQKYTSDTLKSSSDSVQFTDFKPVYACKSKYPDIYITKIDKIEYTKKEMILYICLVNNLNNKDLSFPIFKKKDESFILTSYKKIFYIHDIKNIDVDGISYPIGAPKDSILQCNIKAGGKITFKIYFPLLPKEIKTVSLITSELSCCNSGNFDCYNIHIKSSLNDINDKKEKDLLNKMELNKPLTLNNIYFETGKSELLESSYDELNTLFNILISKPKMIIQISGYTDNVGNKQDNLVLSEARANAVKKYLLDKGIDNNRIIAKGYGSGNPKASNDTEEGRAQNRRVEIMVLKNE